MNIFNTILVVLLDVFLHALFGSFEVKFVVFVDLTLFFNPLVFETLQHEYLLI